MAWVKEVSAATGITTPTVSLTVPAGGFPAGHFLVLGIVLVVSGVADPAVAVSDSKGNTWITDRSIQPITGQATYVLQSSLVVATTLNAGDTITVNAPGNTPNRYAVTLQEFDDVVASKDAGSTNDNGGASTASLTSGSFTTANANNLIVNIVGLVSSARVFTPGINYTGGTKVVSTAGTGDRAVVAQWRYVTSTGTFTTPGTLNTGSVFGSTAQAYSLGAARSGKAKVWDGSAWVSHPVKVWDGSAWVAHPAKGYDGSSWVTGK
jgi:hypothetical protein